MSAGTTTPAPAKPVAGLAVPGLWLRAGLVLAGVAWALGLETAWWQRVLMAVAGLSLALLDAGGRTDLGGERQALAAGLSLLGWTRIPLAVAGGCWLSNVLMLPATGRVALAAAVVAVALMERGGRAAAPAGGTR
jgi:hypothetical protein